MHVHDIGIFTRRSMRLKFDTLSEFPDVTLTMRSKEYGEDDTRLTVFFEDIHEATNFKNEVVQAWEKFLKKKENSNG